MTDPKIDLKTPWVAGLLAYLIPGAGHLYQRRFFKAGIYFVCIFGTFLYGMSLGEWKVVYWTENPGRYKFANPGKRNYGYLTQLGIGVPSLYAFLQSRRYRSAANRPYVVNQPGVSGRNPLDTTLDAEFQGQIVFHDNGVKDELFRHLIDNKVTGKIHLEPHNNMFRGTIIGTIESEGGVKQDFKRELGLTLFLDSRILGHDHRQVEVGIFNEDGNQFGELIGHVPRPFTNWFEAPLDDAVFQDLNGRLTKRFEMALVFTWIAGLLNILAIWDAAQGPAYGYDDEQRKQRKEKEAEEKEASQDASPDESQEAKAEVPDTESEADSQSAPAPASVAGEDLSAESSAKTDEG